MIRIVLDAMGGDNAPRAIIEGALLALGEYEDISICLVGKKEAIAEHLRGREYDPERIDVVDAREEIEMAEPPVNAIRTKKDSSMVVGMNLVAEGKGDVFLTAGSTGATVAGATLIIRRAKGVERPALAPVLPTAEGSMLLVDCGANVDCKPSQLRQFGIMGSIYMRTVMGVENPRVGLINNGAEEEKGNAQTKKAFGLLKDTDINFVGNVEGRDLMLGACDVAVSDGFVGNVVMKFLEGCAKALMSMLKDELMSSTRSKLGAALAKPAFSNFKKKMDYTEYGGALMLGVNGGVIKAHGSSNANAIKNAIRQARTFTQGGVVEKIKAELAAVAEKEAADRAEKEEKSQE